jgi:hypothetical protein
MESAAYVADRSELVREVLAARLRGIEVALDGHANAAADDAVPVAAAQGGLHARDALVRHALEQTDVEAQLIPLDGGADDAHKGERHAGLPVLGAFQYEIVQRLANLRVLAVEGVGEVCEATKRCT